MNKYDICSEELYLDTLTEMIKLRSQCERALTPITQKYGLTPMQAITLHLISAAETSTVSTVFKSLSLNQGNASSLCKRLEEEGFITRQRGDSDERKVLLSLTNKGQSALRGVCETISLRLPSLSMMDTGDIMRARECIQTLGEITARANKLIEIKGVSENA